MVFGSLVCNWYSDYFVWVIGNFGGVVYLFWFFLVVVDVF